MYDLGSRWGGLEKMEVEGVVESSRDLFSRIMSYFLVQSPLTLLGPSFFGFDKIICGETRPGPSLSSRSCRG